MMPKRVLIVSDITGEESARRLKSLIQFTGLASDVVNPREAVTTRWKDIAALLIDANALQNCPDLDIHAVPLPILFYGWHPSHAMENLAHRISGGVVSGIRSADDGTPYRVAQSADICGPWRGLEFGPSRRLLDATFNLEKSAKPVSPTNMETIVEIGNQPFFMRLTHHNHDIYLLGCAGVVNLQTPASRPPQACEIFSGLVCYLLFLKYFIGDGWRLPQSEQGCVVIDDPLLRPRYGCVDYRKLLAQTREHNYSVCVAHIPSNLKKTKPEVADFFRANADRLSIAMHGCNHLRGEFSSTDRQRLHRLASSAINLMQRHTKETGLEWNRVMVFPHGSFSTDALQVLDEYGINAAFVSQEAFSVRNPASRDAPPRLMIADFLHPCISAYGGIPVLLRHYPENIAEFALDILLGRPIIVTTHHASFCHGASRLHTLIDKINTMLPNLKWTSLAIISVTCKNTIIAKAGEEIPGHDTPTRRNGMPAMLALRSALKRRLMTLRDNLPIWIRDRS